MTEQVDVSVSVSVWGFALLSKYAVRQTLQTFGKKQKASFLNLILDSEYSAHSSTARNLATAHMATCFSARLTQLFHLLHSPSHHNHHATFQSHDILICRTCLRAPRLKPDIDSSHHRASSHHAHVGSQVLCTHGTDMQANIQGGAEPFCSQASKPRHRRSVSK